jgi:hypothetical protein
VARKRVNTASQLQHGMLADVRYGSWPCKNVCRHRVLGAVEAAGGFGAGYALIAAINGLTPMMLITLVML